MQGCSAMVIYQIDNMAILYSYIIRNDNSGKKEEGINRGNTQCIQDIAGNDALLVYKVANNNAQNSHHSLLLALLHEGHYTVWQL